MKKLERYYVLLFVMLISLNVRAFEQTIKEDLFDNLSIRQIRIKDKEKMYGKLIVQPFTNNLTPNDDDLTQGKLLWNPIYGRALLELTNDLLPITETDCSDIDATLCKSDSYTKNYWYGACNNSCIIGGPRLLTYDKKNKIVYFAVSTTFSGTAGQMSFVLSSSLNDKKIRLLTSQFNVFDATLSPDSRYLVFTGSNSISIFDTKTRQKTKIAEKNIWTTGKQKLHYLGNVKWKSDSQFTYEVGIRHSKFQSSFDEMKENTYDIAKKKILDSRTMPKSSYDSTRYTDSI